MFHFRGGGALQIGILLSAVQECGWEWSGTTRPEGSTVVTMKEPSTSHAGRAREEGRASPHMRVWLVGD